MIETAEFPLPVWEVLELEELFVPEEPEEPELPLVFVAVELEPDVVATAAKRSVEAYVVHWEEAGVRGWYGGGVNGSGIDQVETTPLVV